MLYDYLEKQVLCLFKKNTTLGFVLKAKNSQCNFVSPAQLKHSIPLLALLLRYKIQLIEIWSQLLLQISLTKLLLCWSPPSISIRLTMH